jgi:hypothetical protein
MVLRLGPVGEARVARGFYAAPVSRISHLLKLAKMWVQMASGCDLLSWPREKNLC